MRRLGPPTQHALVYWRVAVALIAHGPIRVVPPTPVAVAMRIAEVADLGDDRRVAALVHAQPHRVTRRVQLFGPRVLIHCARAFSAAAAFSTASTSVGSVTARFALPASLSTITVTWGPFPP